MDDENNVPQSSNLLPVEKKPLTAIEVDDYITNLHALLNSYDTQGLTIGNIISIRNEIEQWKKVYNELTK